MTKTEEVRFMSDGANIEYTISGNGPKLLLIHGSQGPDNQLTALIRVLEKRYTVFCADRRGWGNSGAKGQDYSMNKECSDATTFMTESGIEYIFGVEYGAVIAMHVALRYPVKKMILFEPYLTVLRKMNWIPKLARQIRKEDYFSAMVTFVKGTNHRTRFVPGFFLKFMFKHSSFSIDRDKEMMTKILICGDQEQDARNKKDIESEEWKLKKRMLRQVASELSAAQESEAELNQLSTLDTKVLLICERDNEPYVYDAVANLVALIPNSKKIVVDWSNDKNRKPLVPPPADTEKSIAQFFAEEVTR